MGGKLAGPVQWGQWRLTDEDWVHFELGCEEEIRRY
jgi:hypothetical protein